MTAAKRKDAQVVLHLCVVEREQTLAIHFIVGEAFGELSQVHLLQPLDHILGGPGADVVRVKTPIYTCRGAGKESMNSQVKESMC